MSARHTLPTWAILSLTAAMPLALGIENGCQTAGFAFPLTSESDLSVLLASQTSTLGLPTRVEAAVPPTLPVVPIGSETFLPTGVGSTFVQPIRQINNGGSLNGGNIGQPFRFEPFPGSLSDPNGILR